LVNAGVQTNAITQSQDMSKTTKGCKSEVKVRLLLPSGQRTESIFAANHKTGLVYDLVLTILDRECLLWSQSNEDQLR